MDNIKNFDEISMHYDFECSCMLFHNNNDKQYRHIYKYIYKVQNIPIVTKFLPLQVGNYNVTYRMYNNYVVCTTLCS